jgi:hypothetical protein
MNAGSDREDRLMRRLAALPRHEAPPQLSRRVRRQALVRLGHERAMLGLPWMGRLTYWWSRVGLPAALASVIGVYLTWAYQVTMMLYR